MATIIRVPSGADTADTLLGKWLKGIGDSIAPRSPVCELSLEDKRFTVTSPAGGELLYLAGSEGTVLCPGQMLAIVGEPGEKVDSLLAEGREAFTDEPVAFMRKSIAQRLTQWKQAAPHFYVGVDVDMEQAVRRREELNRDATVRISINDLIIEAAAKALRAHPEINSSWHGASIRRYQHIHIGMVVAVPGGIVAPVLRFADTKNVRQIAELSREYGRKAKDRKLEPTDWVGSTFTVSNLGMFGVDEFCAIVNPPDAAILAAGAIRDVPVVRNGQVVPGKLMKVTLSCDHRVIDGAAAAGFLQTLKRTLESPSSAV